MRTKNISTKAEVKAAVTSDYGGYNYFEGDIRNNNRYARVTYSFSGNRISIMVSYWEDNKSTAIERFSFCSSVRGLVSKVSRFLNVK